MKKILLFLVPLPALLSFAVILWIVLTLSACASDTADSEALSASLSNIADNGTGWPMVDFDYDASGNSLPTVIGKDNVSGLQVE